MTIHRSRKNGELNLLGLPCPYPEVLTAIKLREMHTNDVLEMVLDSPPSVGIIKNMAFKYKFSVILAEKVDTCTWKIIIKKW
ncbi:MAG: sulfurtransferase TusA family protein [Nitrososphaerota archaeon]|jgi:TusA-related sulfurtransferase|nr:sulfurtransferase TusA family protein [Nitrososphaerota archaeon]MDG6931478.1 sulfurtransferase TusA family protein [Nitrososphaerota archaeon]MDG6936417.1 sulfurtransferase TusA family protein [Nitrososphaerota archaeon]MDG6944776.1 sulfurtransferase TusA family protein [Nitrososphaerota archaeon]